MNSKTGYSYEIDTWAIGVILYALIIGKPPFETKEVKTTYWRIQNTAYEFPESVPISVEAQDLISNILKFNPEHRLSLSQIREHAFFTKCHFIPTTLPVACITEVIAPDQLMRFEKGELENSRETIQRVYFEERDSNEEKYTEYDVVNKGGEEEIGRFGRLNEGFEMKERD